MKLNPRDLQKAMQRMGIQQQEVDAHEVLIKCEGKEIVIKEPQVAKVNMMGQETWQITGKAEERAASKMPEISEEDLQTVMSQTGKNKEEALKAIKEAEGDLAQAILKLS
jgi:nascent polypeptide-associated complex subunit alpha